MVAKSETRLQGWKEICAYMGMSQPTLAALVKDQGFPVGKMGRGKNGRVVSDTREIDEWNRRQARVLDGMGAICAYVCRTEATVLDWVRTRDFPAYRVGEIWRSHRDEVDVWKASRVGV